MPTPTTILVDQGNNQSAVIDTPFTTALSCLLYDELGNLMPFTSVTFQPAAGVLNPSGNFAGATPPQGPLVVFTTFVGRAFASQLTANSAVGAWNGTVFATAVPAVAAAFTATNILTPTTPEARTIQLYSGGTQNAAINTAYQAVTVRVLDQYSDPLVGGVITMTVPAGHGEFTGGGLARNATTIAGGYATFPVFNANNVVGDFAVAYSAPTALSTNGTFTNIDPTLVTLVSPYSGSGQNAAPSFPFAAPLVAQALNAVGAPMAGVTITFTQPAAGAASTWNAPFTNPVSALTDVNGRATTPTFTANATAGTYTVSATTPGAQTGYFQLTNGGSPPALDSALLLCEV